MSNNTTSTITTTPENPVDNPIVITPVDDPYKVSNVVSIDGIDVQNKIRLTAPNIIDVIIDNV